MILLAPSNLNAELMAPTGRPFQRRCSVRSAADHAHLWRGSWAFERAMICHQGKVMCNRRTVAAIPMVRWLKIWQDRTTKRKGKIKLLLTLHIQRGTQTLTGTPLNGTHNAPWIGAWDSNTGYGLATPGGAPLHQCCLIYPDNFVSFVANTQLSVQNRPAGCLLKMLAPETSEAYIPLFLGSQPRKMRKNSQQRSWSATVAAAVQ